MRRLELINELSSRISEVCRDHPVRVAIDGVDASGKTMLADELVVPLYRMGRSVIRASIDGFHNPATIRRRRGAASAEGYYYDSFNYTDLIKELLVPLGPGGSLRYRRAVFDFRADSPLKAAVEEAPFDAVLLFDGVFLLRPELCEYWDFAIFVHADFEVTVRRAEVRDRELFGSAATVRNRYQQRYIPGQRLYLFEVEPERRANVVIDNNTPDHPRLVHVVRKSESRKGGENDPVNCQKPHVAYGL